MSIQKILCKVPRILWGLVSLALAFAYPAFGQESITGIGIPVSQNFNGMGASTNASLPAAWRVGTNWSTGATTTTASAGTVGTGAINSSSAGGCYNWANGTNATSTDRAPGFLTSSSYLSPRSILYAFQNNSGAVVTSLTIQWNYEKYRSGLRAYAWTFFHGSTPEAALPSTGGDLAYAADGDTATVFNPPGSTAKSVTIVGLNIPAGAVYYLRWTCTGSGGSSNSQGLGVDDFSITLNNNPSLAASGALVAFSTPAGTASSSQTFTASGSSLTAAITVAAPADFEVSSDGSSFADTATVPQSAGVANGTVWARIKASAPVGSKSGNIVLSSAGAANVHVPVSGTVTDPNAPSLVLSKTVIANLDATVGVASFVTNYTVSGSNLATSVAITPSLALLEVGTNGTDFANSLTLSTVGGSVSSPVYLRVVATNLVTNYSATVSHVSGLISNALTVHGAITNLPAEISLSTNSLAGFVTTTNEPSSVKTFSFTGSKLVGDISVRAPAGYEVAADGVTWGSNATIAQTTGTATGTISVRLAAPVKAGAPAGVVSVSNNATNPGVQVSGFVTVEDTFVSLVSTNTGAYSNNFSALGTATITNAIAATTGLQTSIGGIFGNPMRGWYATRIGGSGGIASSSISANNGSSTASGVQNYGTNMHSDRALGSLAGGTIVAAFGALVRNDTGRHLLGVRLGFTAEFWRSSASETNTLTFGYGLVDGASVTTGNFLTVSNASALSSADVVGPAPAGVSDALNGNHPANQAIVDAVDISRPLAPGQVMFLRWRDVDDAGSDAGLAIDNLTITAVANDAIADLSGLVLGGATLNPAFNSSITAYSATVAHGTGSLTVTPTAADVASTIEIRSNGGAFSSVSSGGTTGPLALEVGSNTIEVKVTSLDGTVTKSFVISVTRLELLEVTFGTGADVPVLAPGGYTAAGKQLGAVTLGFAPTPGQVLTVVNNTSAGSVVGTFGGLAEGDLVTASYGGNAFNFRLSYVGGDGNDITLTRIGAAGQVDNSNFYAWSTWVGSRSGPDALDATGSAARFSYPEGAAVDSAGSIYVADTRNHTIRKISSSGVVTTLAGTAGTSGSADGTGSAARFNYPSAVAVDGAGNIYAADYGNHTIRKISSSGVVTTLAGTAGTSGSADGAGDAARFNNPQGVAVDGAGNVYVADTSNHTIRKVTWAGVVTTLAGTAGTSGSADGTGGAARLNNPQGVAVDGAGNVYVADTSNHTIRKVTAAGVVTTLAGTAGTSGSTDGTGSAARFNVPAGVTVDSAGNVYVGDYSNNTIRKITPAGVVTTLAGSAGWWGSADGTGGAARFNKPECVAVDGAGNVYVADTSNHTIRKVTAAGVVTTLAGEAAFFRK